VAKAGGGVERLAMTGLFAEGKQSFARVPLAPFLAGLAVLLVVAEVIVRRFLAGPRAPRRAAPKSSAVVGTEANVAVSPSSDTPQPTPASAGPPSSVPEAPPPPAQERRDPLAEARERARKRTQR
ncbi:MAG: hypothetical protein JNJ54_36275, partial [Myxococcaceae bacterium]|nr:hypothetical protein [Myxococcaceae bacterium]